MIQAVLFDLDGTLADTIPAIQSGLNRALADEGYPTHSYDEVLSYVNHGARALIRNALPAEVRADDRVVDRVLARYEEAYAETYTMTRAPYEGITEALGALARAGLPLVVLSNKQDAFVKKLVPILLPGLSFVACIGQREGLPTKPDPTVPLALAEQMGIPPAACAFVGDSDVDIETARRAGMQALGAGWGFRTPEALRAAGAALVAAHPGELVDLILSH